MAARSASEVAQKWSRNAQAAQAEYTAGINRVTTSPTAAAAAAVQTWQARVADPATAAKFRRKLEAISLEQWKQAASTHGAARFAQGVAAKETKFERAIGPVLQYIDSGLGAIKSMPKATFEDRLQRSAAWQRYMHNYHGQG